MLAEKPVFAVPKTDLAFREKMAEQDFRGGLALARREGFQEGEARGLRAAVLDLCEVLGLPVGETERAALQQLDVPALVALRDHLKRTRAWPPDLARPDTT